MRLAAVLAIVACSSTPAEPTSLGAEPCNGWPELCDRTPLEITTPMTHNSHATLERGYHQTAANHLYAIPTQLEDGIRALNVDVYEDEGEMVACHGYCSLGSQPLSEVWAEITDFLDDHPREVVWLLLQDGAPLDSTLASFDEAGMPERAYVHGESWLTLGEMIDDDTRLILSGGGGGGDEAPWYHRQDALSFATNYGYPSPQQMDCQLRGDPLDGGLFELVHTFLDPIAWEDLSEAGNPDLADRLEQCEAEVGLRANLLTVDWYHHGDVVGVAAEHNGLDPADRRTP